jgi:hypothetical protein
MSEPAMDGNLEVLTNIIGQLVELPSPAGAQ